MISDAMKERLRQIGVFLHTGGLKCDDGDELKVWPFLALCAVGEHGAAVSEEPTEGEISLLAGTVQRLIEKFEGTVTDFQAQGVDMVTLLKSNGRWCFRRKSQGHRESWYPPCDSLEDVCNRL